MPSTASFQVDVRYDVSAFEPIIRASVVQLAREIREKSRQDIAHGGHFGARFTRGLTTSVRKVAGGYKIAVREAPSFAKVFEYGGVSVGKPMLWIAAPGSDAVGKRAKAYGPLIKPRGRNILISPKDHTVKYIGIQRVINKKRFHLRDIAVDEANKFTDTMMENAAKP